MVDLRTIGGGGRTAPSQRESYIDAVDEKGMKSGREQLFRIRINAASKRGGRSRRFAQSRLVHFLVVWPPPLSLKGPSCLTILNIANLIKIVDNSGSSLV